MLEEVKKGLKDSWATFIGFIPVGLAFGLVVTQAGFAWWWAPIFSTIIYAGSSEFLALSMIGQGMGAVSAAFAAFAVNFRHIFYGLTFPRHEIKSRLGRTYSAYSLIDEVYGLTSVLKAQGETLSGPRLLTIQFILQISWVGSGILGGLAGEVIPPTVQGLSFALIALFTVLSFESFYANPDWSLVIMAIVFAVIVALVLPGQILTVGITAFFIVVLIRHLSPRLDARMELRRRR